jgi:pSer/pThr/pTyr-binding forkhead associated (FHA) protein
MDEYSLEIVEGPQAGRRIPVSGPLELGRDPGASAQLLEDERVSRRHARLTPAEGGVLVEDLDSTNGTFVNGDEIHSPARLVPGDKLLVGVTLLELRTAAQVAARPTAVVRVPEPLAIPQPKPDYLLDEPAPAPRADQLYPLLDRATKRKARLAPLAIVILVALVVMIYFATR